jgi:antitoxin VapB
LPLTIQDVHAETLVRELTALTGEGEATAIRVAVEERLQRLRSRTSGRDRAADLMEIGAHCAALRDLDRRSADDILGYDANGLPA